MYEQSLYSFVSFSLRYGNINVFQSADEFPSINKIILNLHNFLFLYVSGVILSSAEASSCFCHTSDHAVSLPPRAEVRLYLRRKFESIEVAADEAIGIELLITWEEVAIEGEPFAISQHVNRKKRLYTIIYRSTLFFYMEADPQEKNNSTKSLKIKVGIFFGYNGQNFLGLQYQRDTANTIENTLHRVLCDNGFVLKTNMANLRRIKWSRAGRTDKRVHALCNGISASLEFDDRYIIDRQNKVIDFEKVVKDINAELPFDIRIFTIKKVGKGFDMRHDAASRIYNYIAPLRLLMGKDEQGKVLNELQREQIVVKLNKLVELYLGTHNFHNFTKGYKQTDPRCDRYIMSMKAQLVEEEVVSKYLEQRFASEEERKAHSITFIRFTLVGQSFIYHQIRKMVGLLVKICYEGLEGEATIAQAFGKERYDVYLAPGEGLYLNRMTFEGYNKKKSDNLQVQLNEQDQVRITKYRNYLQSKILSHQINDKVFTSWLVNHDNNPNKEDESQEEKSVNNE